MSPALAREAVLAKPEANAPLYICTAWRHCGSSPALPTVHNFGAESRERPLGSGHPLVCATWWRHKIVLDVASLESGSARVQRKLASGACAFFSPHKQCKAPLCPREEPLPQSTDEAKGESQSDQVRVSHLMQRNRTPRPPRRSGTARGTQGDTLLYQPCSHSRLPIVSRLLPFTPTNARNRGLWGARDSQCAGEIVECPRSRAFCAFPQPNRVRIQTLSHHHSAFLRKQTSLARQIGQTRRNGITKSCPHTHAQTHALFNAAQFDPYFLPISV